MSAAIQKALLIAIILGGLAGCGQKGPLYREGGDAPPAAEAGPDVPLQDGLEPY